MSRNKLGVGRGKKKENATQLDLGRIDQSSPKMYTPKYYISSSSSHHVISLFTSGPMGDSQFGVYYISIKLHVNI